MLDKMCSKHRLCWTKPNSGIGYAKQNHIIYDSVLKICKTVCVFRVKHIISVIREFKFLSKPFRALGLNYNQSYTYSRDSHVVSPNLKGINF